MPLVGPGRIASPASAIDPGASVRPVVLCRHTRRVSFQSRADGCYSTCQLRCVVQRHVAGARTVVRWKSYRVGCCSESADVTNQSCCRMCGAPTPAAHISANSRRRNPPFHVRLNNVEPDQRVRAGNLLAKYCCRAALLDEPETMTAIDAARQQPQLFACRAERLGMDMNQSTRGDHRPACSHEGEFPSADPGEEMALGVSSKVSWSNILNVSFSSTSPGGNCPSAISSRSHAAANLSFVVVVHYRTTS